MVAARGRLGCALVAAAALGAAGSVAQAQVVGNGCGYEIIETLPNGPTCGFGPYVANILDINDAGTVCGYLTAGFCPNLAFMQEPGGPLVILPVPTGAAGAQANALNESGVLVGSFIGAGNLPKPCKWENGICIPLPMLPNADTGVADEINSANLIVGYCNNTVAGPIHACAWQDRQIIDIHPSREWNGSRAVDVNDVGQIAGTVLSGATTQRAFRRTLRGDVLILPPVNGGSSSRAAAIDAHGDVAGFGDVMPPGSPNNVSRGFLCRAGQMIDIGLPSGATSVVAFDLSNTGRIVGTYFPAGRTFVWQNGVIAPLIVNGMLVPNLNPSINSFNWITNTKFRYAPLPIRAGDIDRNCAVNTDDLIQVIVNWGETTSPADVNMDGIVDSADLQIVLDDWS